MFMRTICALKRASTFKNVKKCTFCSDNTSALRSTQAAEVFRSSFAKMASSDVTIQTSALDHLVGETKTRPSVLIDLSMIT